MTLTVIVPVTSPLRQKIRPAVGRMLSSTEPTEHNTLLAVYYMKYTGEIALALSIPPTDLHISP